MLITPPQNRRLHQLLNQMGLLGHKHTLVWHASNQRTESSKELQYREAIQLIKQLEHMVNTPEPQLTDRMRKAVIAQFLEIGKTAADAIAWAEKYGVNGHKRPFNAYNTQELWLLIQNAKQMKIDLAKAVAKSMRNEQLSMNN